MAEDLTDGKMTQELFDSIWSIPREMFGSPVGWVESFLDDLWPSG